MESLFDNLCRPKLFLLVVLAVTLFLFTQQFLAVFQPFAAGVLIAAIASWLWLEGDDHLFKGVNTYEEIIINRNLSYALVLLALAVIISVSILAAFVVFLALR